MGTSRSYERTIRRRSIREHDVEALRHELRRRFRPVTEVRHLEPLPQNAAQREPERLVVLDEEKTRENADRSRRTLRYVAHAQACPVERTRRARSARKNG